MWGLASPAAAAAVVVGASDGFFFVYVICTSSQVQVGIQYRWIQVTLGYMIDGRPCTLSSSTNSVWGQAGAGRPSVGSWDGGVFI